MKENCDTPRLAKRGAAFRARVRGDGDVYNAGGDEVIQTDVRQGKVRWFNAAKGCGFIDIGDGVDVFVHYSEIQTDGYRTLAEGASVTFVLDDTPRGRMARQVVETP